MNDTMHSNEVDIWHVRLDQGYDQGFIRKCELLLSTDEILRSRRFVFAKDRYRYLVSHAFLRQALSFYADMPPARWTFRTNQFGKPEIDAPGPTHGLHFNLSHTYGLAVCAIRWRYPVGIDVESVTKRLDCCAQIAKRFFAGPEFRNLERVAPSQQLTMFLRYWTLKESYIKAKGVGLSQSLRDFAFELAPNQSPQISFLVEMEEDREKWSFVEYRPTNHHLVAVATANVHEKPIKFNFRGPLRCWRDDP